MNKACDMFIVIGNALAVAFNFDVLMFKGYTGFVVLFMFEIVCLRMLREACICCKH